MQITILGGAGGMGSRATADLAGQTDVESLILGDINLEAAVKLANKLNAELGTDKVKPVKVDATSPETLKKAMAGSSAAASAIGPYFKFGHHVINAAIEAGTAIVDICDDFDAVEKILGLNDLAVEKETTVLTGMGWTPGLSNMLAVKGMSELDKTREVNIYWLGSTAGESGNAVILHTLHIFTGMIPTYKNKQLVDIPAGSGKEEVNFSGIGSYSVFHVGHPEPVTLGRFYEDLEKVSLKGGLTSEFLNNVTVKLCRSGLSSSQKGKDRIAYIVAKALKLGSKYIKGEETRSAIKVEIKGSKNGQPASVIYEANADMADLTGLPLSIGTLMLARKEIVKKGVHAPEDVVDFNKFISEMEARGVKIQKTV